MELSLRAELAVRGLRAAPPVRRRAGAGPSDDGHWVLADPVSSPPDELAGSRSAPATLPLAPTSPFALDTRGRLTRDGVVVEDTVVEAVERPRFYDLETADGIPFDQLARLHGRDVLATTVVQTCIRYTSEDTRCRFCTIEESLRAGATTQVKRPDQLAEVAAAAVRLDGVRQMVMTTGTSGGADRGAKHLCKCVRAVKAAVPGMPIQVQIEPPVDPSWIDALSEAGADAIGIHIEALDQH
ncbi:MAG: radical SAM protein, partial [Actinomycetota bacterium]|nr:radical SAM protein [Actinomycetota bacterium]